MSERKVKIEIDELMLLSGVPYKIEGVGSIRAWKLIEVASMGEKEYSRRINITCFDVEDLVEDVTEEQMLHLKDTTTFDIIFHNCISDNVFQTSFSDVIEELFGGKVFMSVEDYCFYVEYEGIDERGVINKDNYEHIKLVLRRQNGLPTTKKKKPVAGNQRASKFMKQMEDMKKKYQKFADKNNKITTTELVNAVAWKSGIGISDAFQMTVYQLYQALEQLNIVDNYDNTMFGVYTGNVDTKKMDKGLNWIKKGDKKK